MLMLRHWILLLLATAAALTPAFAAPAKWNRVAVAPMKTSIYVGSVKLLTTTFTRDSDQYHATYQAKVFPWAFWNERGSIVITLTDADRAKLERGERCEFTGDALNHKDKPRTITGHADPTDATHGKIKVRIGADGVELIFNGTYELSAVTDDQPSSAQ